LVFDFSHRLTHTGHWRIRGFYENVLYKSTFDVNGLLLHHFFLTSQFSTYLLMYFNNRCWQRPRSYAKR